MVGGAGIWTPGCTVIGSQNNINQFIKSLFADGTQGLYLNAQDAVSVSDLSSIKDLSGRNNHALQANATSRATLITDPSGYKSLKFDGIDDGYVTQSIDFTGTDKVTVIAAVRKLSDVPQIPVELSANANSYNGAFYLLSGTVSSGTGYMSMGRGTNVANTAQAAVSFTYPAPDVAVLSVKHDISGDLSSMRRNGVVGIDGIGDKGTGNFGNYPLMTKAQEILEIIHSTLADVAVHPLHSMDKSTPS